MGCSSNSNVEFSNGKETVNSFKNLEKRIKDYKEAINEYKKYKEEYEDILEQQILCERELKKYFSNQKKIIMENEPQEIRNFQKTFNKVNRLEKKLNIVPGCLTKYKNNNKNNKKNSKKDNEKEKENEKDNEKKIE